MPTQLAERRCRNHPRDVAAVACGSCGIALCDRCFVFTIDAAPGCARCAFEIETRPARKPTFAVTFVGILLGGGYFLLTRMEVFADVWMYYLIGAVIAVGGALVWAWPRPEGAMPAVKPRDERFVLVEENAQTPHPYRARARALALGVTPRVSARWTILLLVGCFAVTTALVPALLHLPRWVESEVVLVTWWLAFAALLSALLYRGYRLRHDFELAMPWDEQPAKVQEVDARVTKGSKGCDVLDGCSGSIDLEGVVVMVIAAVAVGVGLGLAWVVVNLAAPLLFLVAYVLLGAAIRRVAHDAHGLAGKLGPSIAWGTMWATLYVAPLLLLIWLVHLAVGG